jgi:two-component system sensor histidine kinase ChiS
MYRPVRASLAIVFFAALLWSCSVPPPLVRQGSADLTTWDFSAQGPAKLDGQWVLWWNRSVTADPGPGTPGYALVTVPGYWDQAGPRTNATGSATYHLRLHLPVAGPLALQFPDISSAWRLTVNGLTVAEQGGATTEARNYRALIRPAVVEIPFNTTELDLFLYVVNASDRSGGIRDSVLIGPADVMKNHLLVSQIDSAFFIGGLVVMALFNVIIFFLQRQKKANVWLAAVTILVAVRAMMTGPRLVHDLWPDAPYDELAKLAFFCVMGAFAGFSIYLKKLFPDWWPTKIFVPFLLYSGVFGILLFVLPIRVYSEAFLTFYEPVAAALCVVCLAVSGWAVKRKHQDGPLVFAGMLFLVIGALNDLLYQSMSLPQGDVIGRFLFIFLVFNTFLLSRQLSQDYALTQRQSQELRQLDKMKDDFLARVTHELRTPLHGMTGILDAFRTGDFGTLSDRQNYHLGLMEASTRRLLAMVNSILDFSHLKKKQLISEPRPIVLKQTVDFLLPSFAGLLKPGVSLDNRVSDQIPPALGDEVKLEQVIHHLVVNALQHTAAGTVALEAETKDQQILLMVRDTGPGIPVEKLARLFSPFQQVDDLDTRATGGLGLGLAISRQLVQQMGGRLEVHSAEGVGTTALVWLPECPPAKFQYFQAHRVERVSHWDHAPVAAPAADEPQPPAPVLENAPTVLIVDDEPVNLLVLRTFLNRLGYAIVEATSGPEALVKVNAQVVDLVVLDIMMPGMSGYEVCMKIRERFSPARLPILLLTAKNQVEDLLQGFNVGASDFLTKPFQRDELKARMELHLKVSQAARTGRLSNAKT